VLLRDELQSQTPKVASANSEKDFPYFNPDPEQASYLFQMYRMMLASHIPNMGEQPPIDQAHFQSFLQSLQPQLASPYGYTDTSFDSSSSCFSQSSDSNSEYCPDNLLEYNRNPSDLSDFSSLRSSAKGRFNKALDTSLSTDRGARYSYQETDPFFQSYNYTPGPGGSYTPESRPNRETSTQGYMQERPRNKTSGGKSDQQLLKAVNLVMDDEDAPDIFPNHAYRKPSNRQPYPPTHSNKPYGQPREAKTNINESTPPSDPCQKKSEPWSGADLATKPSTPLDRDIDVNEVFCADGWIFVQDSLNPKQASFSKPQGNQQKNPEVVTAEEDLFGFKLIEEVPTTQKQPQPSKSKKHPTRK